MGFVGSFVVLEIVIFGLGEFGLVLIVRGNFGVVKLSWSLELIGVDFFGWLKVLLIIVGGGVGFFKDSIGLGLGGKEMGVGVKVGLGAIVVLIFGDFLIMGVGGCVGVIGVGLIMVGGVMILWFCFGDLFFFLGEEGGGDGFVFIFLIMVVGEDCGIVDEIWVKFKLAIVFFLVKFLVVFRGDWVVNVLVIIMFFKVMLVWIIYNFWLILSRL